MDQVLSKSSYETGSFFVSNVYVLFEISLRKKCLNKSTKEKLAHRRRPRRRARGGGAHPNRQIHLVVAPSLPPPRLAPPESQTTQPPSRIPRFPDPGRVASLRRPRTPSCGAARGPWGNAGGLTCFRDGWTCRGTRRQRGCRRRGGSTTSFPAPGPPASTAAHVLRRALRGG